MTKQRFLTMTAASAVLGLTLVGCGGSSESSGSESSGGVSSGGPGGTSSCEESGASPSAAPTSAVPDADDATTVEQAVTATQAFYDTLDSDQQGTVLEDYTDLDAKRCSWSNFPDGLFDGRIGVKLGDMSDEQRTAAMAAVQSLLSAAGTTYVDQMMGGDDYLLEDSGDTNYGSDNYHVVLYGEPSTDTPWTLQFGGHHLAIHVSIGGDTLSVSPYFKGLQPVSYEADGTEVEAMGDLTDEFFGLFESMDDDTLSAAEIDGEFTDLVMDPGTDTGYPDADGVAYTDLDSDQQAMVRSVIEGYVGDMADELSQPLLDLYESQLDDVTVGWSSSIERGEAAYLRLDGPRVWIEWVNTGNPGESGIHYHTIYRDKELDYGTGAEE